jgi:hypothetical protein
MAESRYLAPKVSQSKPDKVKRISGPFVNVGDYPAIGGFTAATKLPKANPSLALEKGPTAKKGKPI